MKKRIFIIITSIVAMLLLLWVSLTVGYNLGQASKQEELVEYVEKIHKYEKDVKGISNEAKANKVEIGYTTYDEFITKYKKDDVISYNELEDNDHFVQTVTVKLNEKFNKAIQVSFVDGIAQETSYTVINKD